MGKKVIPSIIKAFNENNYDFNKVDPDGGFDYLLSFNGNIFRVACDLSFFQSDVGVTLSVVAVSLLLGIFIQISRLT
jgi:hypothetical protein